MKTFWGSGGTAPRIIDLGTMWRWVVSFTHCPLYPHDTQWIGGWVGPRAGLEAVVRRKIPAHTGTRTLDHSPHSPALYHWAILVPEAVVNTVMNPRIPWKVGNFLSSWMTIGLWRFSQKTNDKMTLASEFLVTDNCSSATYLKSKPSLKVQLRGWQRHFPPFMEPENSLTLRTLPCKKIKILNDICYLWHISFVRKTWITFQTFQTL
jgi:hypothetical protein